MSLKPSAVLLEAAEVLAKDGWCRGMFDNYVTGHHCMVGAIRKVARRDPSSNIPVYRAQGALVVDIQDKWPNCGSVQTFNDVVCRDKRHAQSVLRATARRLAKEGS